jgi:hypothetical protein
MIGNERQKLNGIMLGVHLQCSRASETDDKAKDSQSWKTAQEVLGGNSNLNVTGLALLMSRLGHRHVTILCILSVPLCGTSISSPCFIFWFNTTLFIERRSLHYIPAIGAVLRRGAFQSANNYLFSPYSTRRPGWIAGQVPIGTGRITIYPSYHNSCMDHSPAYYDWVCTLIHVNGSSPYICRVT